jgi:hypothetical protein
MDAAPARDPRYRGAPRLLEDFATLERLTGGERPSARTRLELEVGWELAAFLVGALVRPRSRPRSPVPA